MYMYMYYVGASLQQTIMTVYVYIYTVHVHTCTCIDTISMYTTCIATFILHVQTIINVNGANYRENGILVLQSVIHWYFIIKQSTHSNRHA